MPTFVSTLLCCFLFSMSIWHVRKSGYCCQSLSVIRPTWILLLFKLWCEIVSYWLKATEHGDHFYSQTLCHTWVAEPRHCCIISLPWFLPNIGLMAWNTWSLKMNLVWSGAHSKKAWKDDMVTGMFWKEIAFLWRCQYSSLAHYHYNS